MVNCPICNGTLDLQHILGGMKEVRQRLEAAYEILLKSHGYQGAGIAELNQAIGFLHGCTDTLHDIASSHH